MVVADEVTHAPLLSPATESMAQPEPDKKSIVKLNVGGVRYATSLATLASHEGSFFDVLYSGRWNAAQHTYTDDGELFIDRDGEVFKYVLHYLRARATCSETVYLPADDTTRSLLLAEARYFMLPGLESMLLEQNSGTGSFADVYREQSANLEQYISEQPFQAIKDLLLGILLGQRTLKSAWNPALPHGTIMVSLMNAPIIRMAFSVTVASDHVQLTEGINRFKVVLPDQLLESVFSGYYEIYLYEFGSKDESSAVNRCMYNLGTRAVLLRLLQEQSLFDVRMVYDRRARATASELELVLEFHRRVHPSSPRLSQPS